MGLIYNRNLHFKSTKLVILAFKQEKLYFIRIFVVLACASELYKNLPKVTKCAFLFVSLRIFVLLGFT